MKESRQHDALSEGRKIPGSVCLLIGASVGSAFKLRSDTVVHHWLSPSHTHTLYTHKGAFVFLLR